MLKDWPKEYERLRRKKGLDVKRRALLAQGLAATPEERLKMHDQILHSLGLYSYWDREKLGFKSWK